MGGRMAAGNLAARCDEPDACAGMHYVSGQ